MTPETLEQAVAEAKRFLRIASLVGINNYNHLPGREPYRSIISGTKESAACKRASMDLSRALSALRSQGIRKVRK